MSERRLEIGIDTGGTFTDFTVLDASVSSSLEILKVPSTPENPAASILLGLRQIFAQKALPPSAKVLVVHGSTVATNAILERRGARTALLTTEGFRDVLTIGRQNRPALYDLNSRRPAPLVSRNDTFEISERLSADGSELIPVDLKSVQKAAEQIARGRYQAVAIGLLHSYMNSAHEIQTRNALAHALERLIPEETLRPILSLSSHVAPQPREFERFSTTALNAYVTPLVEDYLRDLEAQLETLTTASIDWRMMRSDGGQWTLDEAIDLPLQSVLSGPAGGVMAAVWTAQNAGIDRFLTLDMGGTSTDISLIPQETLKVNGTEISEWPVQLPALDIRTIGAGGGSLFWIDAAGALRVGPQSAGAQPGPACFGVGEAPTVTDAQLILGRIDPTSFLGGAFLLQPTRAAAAFESMADVLGVKPHALAEAGLELVDASIEKAVRQAALMKGCDLRDFTLIAYGGAGGLHAMSIARRLGVSQVLIPPQPGGFSALGMLACDELQTTLQTLLEPTRRCPYESLLALGRDLETPLRQRLQERGATAAHLQTRMHVDMRYRGQSFDLPVLLTPDFEKNFHDLHALHYGYNDPERPTEVVALRCEVTHKRRRPELHSRNLAQNIVVKPERTQPAYYHGEMFECAVFRRQDLGAGAAWQGPAIVTEYSATTFIPPQAYARVDIWGNLLVESSGRFKA